MALAEQSFFFFIPTVSILGVGCAKEAGPKAKSLGFKKALIVTDAGLAKLGVADVIGGYLKAEGVDYVLYSGAEPILPILTYATALKYGKTTAVTP